MKKRYIHKVTGEIFEAEGAASLFIKLSGDSAMLTTLRNIKTGAFYRCPDEELELLYEELPTQDPIDRIIAGVKADGRCAPLRFELLAFMIFGRQGTRFNFEWCGESDVDTDAIIVSPVLSGPAVDSEWADWKTELEQWGESVAVEQGWVQKRNPWMHTTHYSMVLYYPLIPAHIVPQIGEILQIEVQAGETPFEFGVWVAAQRPHPNLDKFVRRTRPNENEQDMADVQESTIPSPRPGKGTATTKIGIPRCDGPCPMEDLGGGLFKCKKCGYEIRYDVPKNEDLQEIEGVHCTVDADEKVNTEIPVRGHNGEAIGYVGRLLPSGNIEMIIYGDSMEAKMIIDAEMSPAISLLFPPVEPQGTVHEVAPEDPCPANARGFVTWVGDDGQMDRHPVLWGNTEIGYTDFRYKNRVYCLISRDLGREVVDLMLLGTKVEVIIAGQNHLRRYLQLSVNRICTECAEKYGGTWPEGHAATICVSSCDVCGFDKPCTDIHDWNGVKFGSNTVSRPENREL